jgi:hypothetical protein
MTRGERNRRESDYLQDRGVFVCQIVPLCLSFSSILLVWVAVNKGLTCFCTVLALCSGKPFDWFMPELPKVGNGYLRCSLTFAIVRVALVERVDYSLMFVSGCGQSSALLSVLGSPLGFVILKNS